MTATAPSGTETPGESPGSPHTLTYAPSAPPAAGLLLPTGTAERYVPGAEFARGGMGTIAEAEDRSLRRRVALKRMLDPDAASEERLRRFISEARITGQLEHPGIVPVYELGVDAAGRVFYAMKLVLGTTLGAILERLQAGDPKAVARYPLGALLTIFVKVCDTVAFAHSRGVIHRDLKPTNVMVGDFGEVLVLDWGLAKVMGSPGRPAGEGAPGAGPGDVAGDAGGRAVGGVDTGVGALVPGGTEAPVLTLDGQVLGTPAFMAPEQARGEVGAVDARTDVYALGAMLYAILTLRPPVVGGSAKDVLANVLRGNIAPPSTHGSGIGLRLRRAAPSQAAVGVPPNTGEAAAGEPRPVVLPHCPGGQVPEALSRVTMRAMAREPADRYASVPELQADVEAWRGGFATAAEGAGLWRHVALFVRRHRAVCGTAAAAALLLVGVAWASFVRVTRERDRALQSEAEAVTAQKSEARLRTTAQYEAYVATIGLIANRIEQRDYAEAVRRLEACPPAYRHWEWGRLWHLTHLADRRLPTESSAYLRRSPDGSILAGTGTHGRVSTWHTDTWTLNWTDLAYQTAIGAVEFTPDGRLLATASLDGKVVVHEVQTGRRVTAVDLGRPLGAVALANDGHTAAVAGWRGDVLLLDLRDPGAVRLKVEIPPPFAGLRFLNDGRLLVVPRTCALRIIELGEGRVTELPVPVTRVHTYDATADGSLLLLGSEGLALAWDPRSGETRQKLAAPLSNIVTASALSADGRVAVSADADRGVYAWDVSNGALLSSCKGLGGIAYGVAALADGKTVAACGGVDQEVLLWSVPGPAEETAISQGNDTAAQAAFSPDGARFIVGGCLYDSTTAQCLQTFPTPGVARGNAFSPDGTYLAIGNRSGDVVVWDLRTPSQLPPIATHLANASLAFLAGSNDLVAGGRGGDATVWDVSSGTLKRSLHWDPSHLDLVRIAASPDGRCVAGLGQMDLVVWDAETGEVRHDLPTPLGGGYGALAYSPDGKTLFANGLFADARTGRVIRRLTTEMATPYAAAFTPDGKRLVTTGGDRRTRVWDTANGRLVAALHIHDNSPQSACFSADGKSLLLSGDPRSAYLLPAADWGTGPAR